MYILVKYFENSLHVILCFNTNCDDIFYIVKLGFTGVYVFFLFLLQNIDRGYSLEPPH